MTSGRSIGIDLRRRKRVAEVLGDAVRCYGHYPVLFAVLALGVVLPYTLIVLAVTGAPPLGQQHVSARTALILVLLDLLLVTPLISALHIHALVDIAEDRQPELLKVARRGVRVLPVVAAAQIVVAIGTAVGFVLLIVPGVLLAIRWAVVAQAAAVENAGWLGALRRSGELTAGAYLHVFGVILIVGLIESGFQRAGSTLVGTSANAPQVLIGIGVETITRSFAALTSAILFFDLLARGTGPGSAAATGRTPRPDFDQA
jgi:hypothetical protein